MQIFYWRFWLMRGIRLFLPGVKNANPASDREARQFFSAFKADLAGGVDCSEARFVALDIETGGIPSIEGSRFGVDPGKEALCPYTGEILLLSTMGIDARYHAQIDDAGDGSILDKGIQSLEEARAEQKVIVGHNLVEFDLRWIVERQRRYHQKRVPE